jgi:predicted AlkP superfamily phosphohydrolase/phosphomutase
MPKKAKKKIVIIGWDGATWDLINPWIKSGDLPFLASLKEKGTTGKLRSTMPALTPPAWTTIFTGVNPGKHGIFDFIELDGYQRFPILSTDRKAPAVWDLASRAGKRVCAIGIPITFPPDEVNGVMVSGLGTPGPLSDFVYPSELKKEVMDILKGDDLFIKDIPFLFERDREGFLKKVHSLMDRQKDLCMFFLKRENWDLFISIFMGIDWIAHFFWKDLDKNHPDYDPEESPKYADAIKDIYKKFDQMSQEIYEEIKDRASFVILSDHGFGPAYKSIYLNALFKKEGYLSFSSAGDNDEGTKTGVKTAAVRLMNKLDRFGFRYLIPLRLRVKMKESVGLVKRSFLEKFNWEKTKAFSYSSSVQGVRINLEGREPQGQVSADEYNKTVKELRNLLENLKDPETKKKVVKKTFTANEVYSGPYVPSAPDILVEPAEGYAINAELYPKVLGPARHSGIQRSGEHRELGIFLASGLGKKDIGKFKAYDFAPTVLKHLGLKAPPGLDGKALAI